jgi:hypothetical protein
MMESTHNHYFDYGYSDWQCIECDTATDYCEADHKVKHSNATGSAMAGRFPEGLPGNAT